MNRSRVFRLLSSLFVTVGLFAGMAGAAGARGRTLGDSEVIAEVPYAPAAGDPGFPEGIALRKGVVYVGGPAVLGKPGLPASRIYAYDVDTGVLLHAYTIEGEDTTQQHGLSALAFDEDGRLYALDEQQGIIRIDLKHGAKQSIYATFADLPRCAEASRGTPCSPTATDRPPLLNDIAFDEEGNAYVTDSLQATIWRVPAGGGAARPWLQDASLDSDFGPNGLRLTPDHRSLYFSNTLSPGHSPVGHIYKVPLNKYPWHPTMADATIFHSYAFEGPDDFAVGESGKVYVALAVSSEISVLDKHGNELRRYHGSAHYETGNKPNVPYDSPASVVIDDRSRSLLVTNHAQFSGIPSHFVVFDVYVDDEASRLVEPDLD